MFIDWSQIRIFIICGFTDMRKSWNGLSGIIGSQTELDPYSGSLYLFLNKRRNLMKILYWDKTGFSIWQKRLGKNRFPWLSHKGIRELSVEELEYLLRGIDIFSEHEHFFPCRA